MRSLKRTLLVRYAAAVVLIVLMVGLVLAFVLHAGLSEGISFLVGLVILLGLLGGITIWTQRTLLADLKEIGRALEKIVVENDLDRMPQPRLEELNDLAQDMDAIASKVRENYRLLSQERDRLQTILENINVGIIVVGKDLKTRMINPVAQNLFETEERFALGRTFTEIHHAPSINKAIEDARRGDRVAVEVVITLPHRRTLEVRSSPIHSDSGKIAGVICILEDVTERRRLESIRRDFVANVSHELRTPIANMRAVVDALLTGAALEQDAAARFTLDLDRESRRLADIIEDLLALSRLESQKSEPDDESFVASELLKEIVEEKAELASKNDIQLTFGIDDAAIMLTGNRKLIKTACLNLVDNAIKYNRPRGSVEISVGHKDESVLITVADTGIGIPAPERHKIFERFYRVDKARSRETGGTGLGLSIVKHVAECHGGTVHVESTVDAGSKFILALPT
ncbi:MAG: hypothetical protein CVT63_03285 [Candidatus Anoxymicrobium japonicum]|uniref:Sensor-like histidine kinase SenX3 n=1 Tax=Candidatus Anoxymicrobium japonicum TaxID=2013648 RepID=A0A2N3G6K0_9ACTN|nr:MAG: hypothetical protein CVT63_03285 [Candidatus Anoxymicrobium japonicum]